MEQIRLPICISSLDNTNDIKNLLLQYSRHLNLNYQQYQNLYVMGSIYNLKVDLPLGAEVSEKDYLESLQEVNCTLFKSNLESEYYCHICKVGADCNKYKREEEYVVAYLLQDIDKDSMEVWHQLKGVVTKDTFVSKYEYREGPPFNVLSFLVELLLNMNTVKIKVEYPFDLEGKLFKDIPSYVKDELSIQIGYLTTTSLPEKTFEQYIEKNNLIPKLIEHSTKVHEKLEDVTIESNPKIENDNIDITNDSEVKIVVTKQDKADLRGRIIAGASLLDGTPMADLTSPMTADYDINIKEDNKDENELPHFISNEKCLEESSENLENSEPDLIEVNSVLEESKQVSSTEKTAIVEDIKSNLNGADTTSYDEEKIEKQTITNTADDSINYYVTNTNNIKQLDCIGISNIEQFNNTYFAQRIGTTKKAIRLEFIPETNELFSYSKDTNEPVVYTFEDREFREIFGMQIIESRGFHFITCNSLPLINYFDNRGHYLDRRNFYDFQLGYTMANFPKDRNKIFKLEDFELLDKENGYINYRDKVYDSIKGYHNLYDKFMEYWNMRELQFRKKYKDEIGLRYLVGRSRELEISKGRGREIVVRNPRGFNYDWLLDPEELINRKDILPDKMLLVGTFKNLKDYVAKFITKDTTTTPLGYPVKVSDEYTLEELKEDVCKEVVRSVLVRMMRHWKSERSSLRLLYFDNKKIILMVDNTVAGRGLAFDSLYYGMGNTPKELLPGIVPENDILEIR